MNLRDMSARDALTHVDDLLRQLLAHPGLANIDRAAIVQAGVNLSGPRHRHMGKWTPCDPATLPPRKAGQKFPELPKGWAVDWENAQETANA